ncbi:MFS transporter [Herbaspirillum sp. SJZ099]|uniref:MFS transporter n=1 Tax=Herbaspirillum sp. SJZ099 TaxID=2572916 RepID=UPI0011A3B89D|nr:putative MFS family arabinose efflux permease [Herbaspirillum sp. SJZ099]
MPSAAPDSTATSILTATPCLPSRPCRQPALSRTLTLLFAIAAGISVANVYYAQPLLDALAADFGIATAAVGMVISATQVGSTLALLLLVPLGDLLSRRRLMLWQAAALAVFLLAVTASGSVWMLLAGMLAVGMLGTAMTQGLISYAAALAPPQERGALLGTVQAGVVIGLLLARLVAGLLADVGGWRLVYLCSAAMIAATAIGLARMLPPAPAAAPSMRYGQLLRSMAGLLLRERVLQVRGVLALLMFAAFNIFWSALVLPLSAPPHAMSHGAIGAFGLVGVIGVLGAARAGRWADRGLARYATGGALLLLLLSWLPLVFADTSLWALVAGILLLDLGGQMIHVTNQSLILRAQPQAHSRMVGCYMMFYAVGSGGGALAATHMYAYAGWGGVCVLGAAVSLAALLWWVLTLRLMPRD